MANYIILNGKNSNTITGLLIQNLPPISKPLQRTLIEEIDGRDGDIVTKLGYGAYDKEITIGLYGSYNVDDVISYFDSEGVVTFSNEPDKYYNYQIIDQIDFERLIRFKTATVRMHVQPFKYLLNEPEIEVDARSVTGEGQNIELKYTIENGSLSITPKGNTEQTTYSGKNLYKPFNFTKTNSNIDFTYSTDGSLKGNGTASPTAISMFSAEATNYLITLSAGTYTISGANNKMVLEVVNSSGTALATTENTSLGAKTFTIDSETQIFIRAKVFTGTVLNNEKIYPQLESGSTATSYEPYCGGIPSPNPDYPQPIEVVTGNNTIVVSDGTNTDNYPLNLGSIELCKIGNYQDYIYKENNKWYKHSEIGKVVLNGTENWSHRAFPDNSYLSIKMTLNVGENGGFCNYFISDNRYDITPEHMTISKQWKELCFAILKSRLTTEDEAGFKDWLSTNTPIVYYVLETPTNTEITDTDLINQLDSINSASAYKEVTNISSTCASGNSLMYMSAVSVGMPNTTIKNNGNIFAKPILTIYGSGEISVYLDTIQVLQIDLGDYGSITIDVSQLEAYNESTGDLMNRNVIGDYSNLKIKCGDNDLTFSGNVMGFTMTKYNRWL